MIYKLPTFDDKLAKLLCNNYFYQQEHFSLNDFIQRMLLLPTEGIAITTKLMISTRTSAFITGLNNGSKDELLNNNEKIDVLNLVSH
jgi:hypothetical protein